MVSFVGGILIFVIVIVVIVVFIRRYVFPRAYNRWRNKNGFGKAMIKLYDWIETPVEDGDDNAEDDQEGE